MMSLQWYYAMLLNSAWVSASACVDISTDFTRQDGVWQNDDTNQCCPSEFIASRLSFVLSVSVDVDASWCVL